MSKEKPLPQDDEPYSTLEVDNSVSLPQVHDDKSKDLPEAVPEEDRSYQLPEAVPEPDRTLPEAVTLPPDYGEAATGRSDGRDKRLCGLRKRIFWAVIVLVAVIVIAVAVAVGVVEGTSKSSPKAQDQPHNYPGFHQSTRLAAVNYTDTDDVLHHRVFYQNESLQIWQADLNNSTGSWNVSAVLVENGAVPISPKEATPLAADVQVKPANSIDFHLHFLDQDNKVRQLNSSVLGFSWTLGALDGKYPAYENSKLASYSKQCSICMDANYIVLQYGASGNRSMMVLQYYTDGTPPNSSFITFPTANVMNVDASDFAMATLPQTGPTEATTAVFLNTGIMYEFLYNDYLFTSWNMSASENIPLDPGSSMATLAQNVDNTYRYIQVLASRANNGTIIATYNGTGSTWGQTTVPTMNNVRALSPIAANQAGRVYALVGAAEDIQLYEWSLATECSGSGSCNFAQIGAVNVAG